MGCFINRKVEKVASILNALGLDCSETEFIELFKLHYPDDWLRIQEKWAEEEKNTLPGKKHPMQHPDLYMKEMYRNGKSRLNCISIREQAIR